MLPTLAALRPSYRLGLASNGNSRAERCGLPDAFAFEVYAHVDGVPKKPSPAFYSVVCRGAAAPPSSIVHVGDSVAHDVVGAQAAGLRAVWLNRAGRPRPSGVHPDAEIGSLAELPSALAALNAANAPSPTAR